MTKWVEEALLQVDDYILEKDDFLERVAAQSDKMTAKDLRPHYMLLSILAASRLGVSRIPGDRIAINFNKEG